MGAYMTHPDRTHTLTGATRQTCGVRRYIQAARGKAVKGDVRPYTGPVSAPDIRSMYRSGLVSRENWARP